MINLVTSINFIILFISITAFIFNMLICSGAAVISMIFATSIHVSVHREYFLKTHDID